MKKINHFNVMLVEDEPLLLKSLERHIAELNPTFQPICRASNGREALELLQDNDIHLIISDIRMPEMTGLELARHVYEQYPHILVLLLTGYADFEYAKEAMRQGVMEYLLKPLDRDELESALTHASILLQKKYELVESTSMSGMSPEDAIHYVTLFIREHYMEDIDFTALSASLGFSSAYLTKLFNKYVEDTPLKYLTDIRIQEAKHLLLNTGLSIKEIGEKVGYPDQFYFSKIFRKTVGVNPSAYRKAQQREES